MPKSTKNKDAFLEKTIEHWLDLVNELGYTLPFCQYLISEGYQIIQVSRQGPFEQGKDIIAIDKDGNNCGFQLKGGHINSNKWRINVKGEVEELVELPINHPAVVKNHPHKSFLVTNGQIEDTVLKVIEGLNSAKWSASPLNLITRGQLLSGFIKLSENFVPQDVSDYKTFLELYFSEGEELIDEEKYASLIKEILRLDVLSLPKAERKRNITSAILYASYILLPFKQKKNYVSIIQTLTLLCSYIFALVEKTKLEEIYWKQSFDIVWEEILSTGKLLQDEIENNGLESIYSSIWDGELAPYRKHLAVSYLYAYKTAQLIQGSKDWNDIVTAEFEKKIKGTLTFWGESALLQPLTIFLYIKKALPQKDNWPLLCLALEEIIKNNGRKGATGLLNPYYGITAAIKRQYDLLEEPIDETFIGRSFLIQSFVDILAKYEKREILEKYWMDISHISQELFTPSKPWQNFIWLSQEGDNTSTFPKKIQKWAELSSLAKNISEELIPECIKKFPYFLPLFLLVFPHRINSNFIKFLDNSIEAVK